MKIFTCYCLVTLLLQLCSAAPHQAITAKAPTTTPAQDVSLLQPADIAYQNAAEFARLLKAEGVEVRSIHRSTLEGFFKGIGNAAFFRTDKGIVEVIFFPGPLDAEKVTITYSRNAAKGIPHKYKVAGQPAHGEGVIYATAPLYFTLHKSWYIVTSDTELDSALKRSLGQSGRQS